MTIEQLLKNHDAEIRVGFRKLIWQGNYYIYGIRPGKTATTIAVVDNVDEALRILMETT